MGWSATAGAVDNFIYDEANATFIGEFVGLSLCACLFVWRRLCGPLFAGLFGVGCGGCLGDCALAPKKGKKKKDDGPPLTRFRSSLFPAPRNKHNNPHKNNRRGRRDGQAHDGPQPQLVPQAGGHLPGGQRTREFFCFSSVFFPSSDDDDEERKKGKKKTPGAHSLPPKPKTPPQTKQNKIQQQGYWEADEEKIERLKQMYNEVEDKIEGVE
jgi:hypothetical protein